MSSLNCAVLTVSDSRTLKEDTSGASCSPGSSAESGHTGLSDRTLVRDDVYKVRAVVSNWIADDDVSVVITTGGTGFTGRDSTPEALMPLFDKTIDGFGELFRQVSYEEIGASTIQSRCVGGLANATLIFALPGLFQRGPHRLGADSEAAARHHHPAVQLRRADSAISGELRPRGRLECRVLSATRDSLH